jgi:hypothetical protein
MLPTVAGPANVTEVQFVAAIFVDQIMTVEPDPIHSLAGLMIETDITANPIVFGSFPVGGIIALGLCHSMFGVVVFNRLKLPIIGGAVTGALFNVPFVVDDNGKPLQKPGRPTDPTTDWIDDPPIGQNTRVAAGVWVFDSTPSLPEVRPEPFTLELLVGNTGLALDVELEGYNDPIGRTGDTTPAWKQSVTFTPPTSSGVVGATQKFLYDSQVKTGPTSGTITPPGLVVRVRVVKEYLFIDIAPTPHDPLVDLLVPPAPPVPLPAPVMPTPGQPKMPPVHMGHQWRPGDPPPFVGEDGP